MPSLFNSLCFCSVLLLVSSCFGGTQVSTVTEKSDALRGTSWVLNEKRDFHPTITFNQELDKVEGSTNCHSYSADLIFHNYFFEIDNFQKSSLFCADKDGNERDFMLRLSEVKEYRIVGQNTLFLKNGRNQILLKFKRKSDT